MTTFSTAPISPTILIVDDDVTTTLVLDGLLKSAGFETACAHDLTGAEHQLRSRPFSLVLLDVNLPDGNGLDLCERLMADRKLELPPILFISASDDLAIKVRGFAAGAVDYITKPLAGAEVLARVRTHLRLRSAYDTLVKLQTERIQRLASTQQSLMPAPASLPAARFEVCLRQVDQAGGDFYDVVQSGNRVTDYVVADASGHDLSVSLWTAAFKALLAEYASIVNAPLDVCRVIDRSLRRILPEGAYFTCLYARLNRASNRLVLVNCGHPSAILVSSADRSAKVLQQEGDLLGIFPDATFGVMDIPVRPGDRLFFYSDGLVEMQDTREDEMPRLAAHCRNTLDLPLSEALPVIVTAQRQSHTPKDDIVLLGVGV